MLLKKAWQNMLLKKAWQKGRHPAGASVSQRCHRG
jgi:hypothetical protein